MATHQTLTLPDRLTGAASVTNHMMTDNDVRNWLAGQGLLCGGVTCPGQRQGGQCRGA